MKVKLSGTGARSGLPIELRPGQSIALAAGPVELAGLKLVPVEFGRGRIKLLARHPAGRVRRHREGAVHVITISPEP